MDTSVVELDATRLPQHVAVIMDGNGRWAKRRGLKRIEGHKAGSESVRRVITECRKLGIRYLTLFSFSTENWKRPVQEVSALMDLFRQALDSELHSLLENNIRLRAIGDLAQLPMPVRYALNRSMEQSKNNTALDVILAVSYGGRAEILHAAKQIASQVKDGTLLLSEIDEQKISANLWSNEVPDPDLLIRTSGEMRISNFLLWQLAYSEIVVTDTLWPDFNEESFHWCLSEFQKRDRRYGLSSNE